MDDRISAYKTILLLEKQEADGFCIDSQCHKECIAELHKAIVKGELQHKQSDIGKFDGLIWMEFIGERMRYANKKVEQYSEDLAAGLSVKTAYNFWLAYAKFYQILYDEIGDTLCRDYNFIPREAANGIEQAFKDFIEFAQKQ